MGLIDREGRPGSADRNRLTLAVCGADAREPGDSADPLGHQRRVADGVGERPDGVRAVPPCAHIYRCHAVRVWHGHWNTGSPSAVNACIGVRYLGSCAGVLGRVGVARTLGARVLGHARGSHGAARCRFPWIDAIMNQLREWGWMHHLARHSVACFLTRGDLFLHWERGRDVFDKYLIDGDHFLNNGNWQWLSASRFFYQYFRCGTHACSTCTDTLRLHRELSQAHC